MPTVLADLNSALHQAFTSDERVCLVGEDVLDPYGGAFKVTRGLSTAFPGRVWTTPISEAGIVGVGTGMALRGLRPVVEIMFGDFLVLVADQLINHAAKFRWMYNDQVRIPLVIRTPMGGRRGYGPTHSQTLEKHFLGVPGLRILAPCALQHPCPPHADVGPGELLRRLILEGEDPTLFIENKLLYLLPVQDQKDLLDFEISLGLPEDIGFAAPTYLLSLRGAPPASLTLTAYGYMAELARQAAWKLAYEHEVFTDLVIPTQLSPFAVQPVLDSVEQTRRLLTIEEGSYSLGWGAEILARASEALGPRLVAARRLAARDLPVPSSRPLEAAVLPGMDDIIRMAREMVGR